VDLLAGEPLDALGAELLDVEKARRKSDQPPASGSRTIRAIRSSRETIWAPEYVRV
jgi:hypothetical protein